MTVGYETESGTLLLFGLSEVVGKRLGEPWEVVPHGDKIKVGDLYGRDSEYREIKDEIRVAALLNEASAALSLENSLAKVAGTT